MLNIPVEVKELLKTNSTPKNFRVIFPNGERADIINNSIVAESVHFTESVMSQDKFKLGLCESPVIEFEVFGIENIKGKKIECYYEIYCEDTVEDAVYREDLDAYVYPIPLGVFYVDSCKKEAKMNIRQVIAYGMQAYFEWKIPMDSTFPMDLSDALAVALQSDETLINANFNTDVYNHVVRQGYDTTNLNIYVVGSGGVTTVNKLYRTVPLVRRTFTNIRISGTSTQYTFVSTQESFESIKETYRCGVNNGGTGKLLFKYLKNGKYYSPMPVYNAYATFLRGFIDPSIDGFEFVSLNIDEREIAGGINKYRYATNPVSCDINVKLQTDFVADIPALSVKNERYSNTWDDKGSVDSLRTLMKRIEDNSDYAGAYAELVDFYSAYPNPFERSLNGDDTDVLLGAYTHDTVGITIRNNTQISRNDMQKYAEDIIELKGEIGRFDRNGEFEAFTLDVDTLVPNDTDLVPSESLVPNGADVDNINPSEYETAWYDDELSLPYGACAANHKVNNTDTYTIVYADGYDADTDPSTYQIYDISNNDLIKEMTVEQITPILTTIITNLSNLRYMPSDIDMVGRPDIEAGDGIQVMSNSGAFNTYVLSRTIDGIQGLSDTITAK